MKHDKKRLMAVSGATLALIVAGTVAVAAHPGDGGGRGGGFGGDGFFGDRGGLRMGIAGGLDGFERREVTVQTTDGTTSQRVEQGIATSVSDAGLEFTLDSGETVTVTIDDGTQAIELSEQTVEGRRGFARERMMPSEIELDAIEAGDEVVVWSNSEDGADYIAQRIVVQPVEADASTEAAEDAAAGDIPATDA
jgi:hypothetical protein